MFIHFYILIHLQFYCPHMVPIVLFMRVDVILLATDKHEGINDQ